MITVRMQKKIFAVLNVISLFFVLTVPAFAQVTAESMVGDTGDGFVPCDGPDCNFCHLIVMVNDIVDFTVMMAVIIGTIMLAVIGFKLVIAKGNPAALNQAKQLIINFFIGMLLVLAAWTLVDTLLKVLLNEQGLAKEVNYGTWNEIDSSVCGGQNTVIDADSLNADVPIEEHSNELLESLDNEANYTDANNALSSTAIAANPTVSAAGVYHPSTSVAPDGSFTYQSGIEAQRAHASSYLNSLLNCMVSVLPGNMGQISSISDNLIVSGSRTWESCYNADPNKCSHSAGSCHYGSGYTSPGQSYAVDFGDEQYATDLIGAAYACGAKYAINERDHVHVSVTACKNK